jgi:hypothetical protein
VREVVAEPVLDARTLVPGHARGRPPQDRPARAGWFRALRLSVGPDGAPFVVQETAAGLRVHVGGGGAIELPGAAGIVQPLGADRWLVAQSRGRPGERNARVYDRAGRLVSTFPVGDAVAHLETTLDDRVWVGYFDEGVLAGGAFAGDGAVCFDGTGRRLFGFNTEGLGALAAGRPPVPDSAVEAARARGGPSPLGYLEIYDLYAMNVEPRRSAWLHYYSAFPLVWVERERVRAIWTELPVVSAQAFAVDGQRALFAGGRLRWRAGGHAVRTEEDVRADAEAAERSFLLVALDTREAEPLRLVTPDGDPLDTLGAFGRGADLFLRRADELYRLDLRVV